jgi:hypothetical protein
VDTPLDLLRAAETGLPMVLKPRWGFGGNGVAILRDDADVDRACAEAFTGPLDHPAALMVEPLCDDDLYHVDGLWAGGELLYGIPSKYVGGSTHIPVERIRGLPSGSVQLDPKTGMGKRLMDVTTQVLDGFPTPAATAFHAEYWVDADGVVRLCEIASRVGGFLVHRNLTDAFGIVVDAVWLAWECGLDPVAEGLVDPNGGKPVAGFRVPYRSGRVERLPAAPLPTEITSFELDPGIEVGVELPPQTQWWQSSGIATVAAGSYAELPSVVDAVCEWVARELVIRP